MAAITDLSDLVNRMTGGNSGTPETIPYLKTPSIATVAETWVAGQLLSFWRYDGIPVGPSAPTTVAVPTNATVGAIPLTSPGGGRTKYLVSAGAALDYFNNTAVLLYDRLLHIGGLDASSTSVQNVQSGSGVSLTRNTGGAGNQIWVEIYSAVGTTARTLTVTYTNQSGTGSRSATMSLGGTATLFGNHVNQVIPVQLQSGDTGVRSVESVQLGTSTGTAGNFGVTIAHPLAIIQRGNALNFVNSPPGLPLTIESDACLAVAGFIYGAFAVRINAMFSFIEA